MYDPYEPRTGVDLYSEVVPRISIPHNPPYMIYGIGLARNGTTVSLNVMASSTVQDQEGSTHAIQTGYQHFKAGYRHAMHGWPLDSNNNTWQFNIPDAEISPVFYTKDPLGPYTHTESIYNPLELLKRIYYPKDKLFLLFFFRDPTEVLASWKKNWGTVRDGHVLRDNLITSSQTLRRIHEQARDEEYAHDIYLYESLRDHPPQTVIERLFEKINEHMHPHTGLTLRTTSRSTSGWDPEDIKNIWHPNEPLIYTRQEISRLHTQAKTSSGLEYRKYSSKELDTLVSGQDREELRVQGVYLDYEYFRSRYVESSGLATETLEGVAYPMQEGFTRMQERR